MDIFPKSIFDLKAKKLVGTQNKTQLRHNRVDSFLNIGEM